MPSKFWIREALPEDLDEILRVAEHLDTVNLPHDRAVIAKLLDTSQKSFAGELGVFQREYLFVLQEFHSRTIVGTTMIIAQHGTRKAPHIFFDVLTEERYSSTLDRHFKHQCLRIGYNYDGPTEIGGLILLPEFRGHPESLGKFLSYTRFLFMGLHREWFRDEVLSELLPPLRADGTSVLWESLGRHFTGLTYLEADRLSQNNKEFIRSLFPEGRIYTSLMPQEAADVVGTVGPETRGVEKIIRAIGFEYADRIDPFDGGPHFMARTSDITIVKTTRRGTVAPLAAAPDTRLALVGLTHAQTPRFRAVRTHVGIDSLPEAIGLDDDACAKLGVAAGDTVGYVLL